MQEGDIVLVNLVQTDGIGKIRPALVLKVLPKYGDVLVCGISSRLYQEQKGIDEILDADASYFADTGLHQTSLVRLLLVGVQEQTEVLGSLGKIPADLHLELMRRLANFLTV